MINVAIIDIGVGNLNSIFNAINKIGCKPKIVSNPSEIIDFDVTILPGVGSFGYAMSNIDRFGFHDCLNDFIQSGRTFIGICLGMQLLFDSSAESPNVKGLSLIEGEVLPLPNNHLHPIPHIGWNNVSSKNVFFDEFEHDFYFLHSFYCKPSDNNLCVLSVDYPDSFCAAVMKENIYGFQFHPEKSQSVGLSLLNKVICGA